jgi:hypothetical protein
MLNLNRPQTWLKNKDKGIGITLLELVIFGAVGIYYLIVIAFMITVVLAGWKYILS